MIYFRDWLQTIEEQNDSQIQLADFFNRMCRLGWNCGEVRPALDPQPQIGKLCKCRTGAAHIKLWAPDGVGYMTINKHRWKTEPEVAIDLTKGDLRNRAIDKNSLLGYPQLDFVWNPKFSVPPDFDIATQTYGNWIRKEIGVNSKGFPLYKFEIGIKDTSVEIVANNPWQFIGKEVNLFGNWHKVDEADYNAQNNKKIDLLFDDDTSTTITIGQKVRIREPMQRAA